MKILVTGGAGFIGTNFTKYLLSKQHEAEITVLDKLTYAGRLENLSDIIQDIQFIKGDICDEKMVSTAMHDCDKVFHFAAESHVDRSISNAIPFMNSNLLGTYTLLEAARMQNVDRFIHISTDEVYGSSLTRSFSEVDRLEPSSPYSASKAGSDLLALSYFTTYHLPVIITRSSNNFGPYQFPEKLVPLTILNALEDKSIPVYGDGKNIRDWMYVMDNCEGINTAAKKGRIGEIYNIGCRNERENIEIVKEILQILHRSERLIKFVHDRPGHDRRYSLAIDKMLDLGWEPKYPFKNALQNTVAWYQENESWWKPLRKK